MKILASAIGRIFLCCALMSYMSSLSHASPLRETKEIMDNPELTAIREERLMQRTQDAHTKVSKDIAERLKKFKDETGKVHSGSESEDPAKDSGIYKHLRRRLSSLESSLTRLENRVDRSKVRCHERNTNWDARSNAPIMYLDRQNVKCPSDYFLASFHLIRWAYYKDAKVRYNYRCCKFVL